MLLDLREQLRVIATPPLLPGGWDLQVASATAGGDRFGGDLVVPALTERGRRLEVVLVDVSGKGRSAGTRALMLAGAISGLLGVVAPEGILPALNAHLVRQEWGDGFATAVHLAVDLGSGAYRVAVAGHPAPVHYRAGSGRWSVLPVQSPLLGVLEDASWTATTGTLAPGDALLLYTDGAVESGVGHDLEIGLDRLLGRAERLVTTGFEGAADALLSDVAQWGDDDISLVMCWRRPSAAGLPPPRPATGRLGDAPQGRRAAAGAAE